MKKPKRADFDVELAAKFAEQYPELAKKVFSQPASNAAARRKARKRKQPKPQQSSIVGRVEEEIGQHVPPELFRNLIGAPVPKLDWTESVEGYEEARLSAENAMRRMHASTDAAQAGFESETPILDVFLYKVRVGLIQSDSAEIAPTLQYAQQIGKAEWFITRLSAESKNAKKRVPGAPEFSEFRGRLTTFWMRYGFWLMSDNLIARLTHVSRQAVAKAVKELALVKHRDTARRPIVKDLDEDGRFVFRQGYPLKS